MIIFGAKHANIENMKKLSCIIAALFVAISSFAQESDIPVIKEIASVEQNDITTLDLFNMPSNGENHYYLCVGSLGHGDEVVQIVFDPVFKLFIPLGNSMDEAIETLKTLQALFKQPVNSSLEMPGCLAFGFPNDKLETVTITYRKPFLSRQLEFSLEREGYIRATYVAKSDIGSIMTSAKIHKKLFPKE